MKKSLMVAVFLSQLIFNSNSNASGVYTDCQSTHLADGGYHVRVMEGYVPGKPLAVIWQVGFAGEKLLGTLPVISLENEDSLKYQDYQTLGTKFTLSIDKKSGEASVQGNINGQVIPPQGIPYFGLLRCTR